MHLKRIKIIHCDLKPENILFTDESHTAVKIIDFGSACNDFKSGFNYVQSRYYRSPEVVLGLPYDQAVDMWSFGCILVELITGKPLFPAVDEHELLELFIVSIGMPPEEMINKCSKRKYFFDTNRTLIRSKRSRVRKGTKVGGIPVKNELASEGDDDFIDFIEVSNPTKMARSIILYTPHFRYGVVNSARVSVCIPFSTFIEMPDHRSEAKADARASPQTQLDQA